MELNLPNTYEIYVVDKYGDEIPEYTKTVMASTPGKAKYKTYLKYEDCYDSFKDFLGYHKIRTIGKCKIEHMYGDKKRFDDTKEYRGVPFALQGMKVEHRGYPGIIV